MKIKKLGRKGVIIILWIALWGCLAAAVDNDIMLASPAEAFRAFLSMLRERDFYLAAGRSMSRIGAGFFAGFAAGVSLAAAGRRFPLLEEALAPVVGLAKAVPVASFVVLFLIWWGSSFLAVAVCFLVVLPNIYIGTLEGLKNTDGQLLEMAQVFRVPFWNRFFYIYRPALKPFLYSGMKVSLGMCWKSGIAAEVIGTPDYSIGERMYLSKIYLDTAGVFAWTAVIVLLSIIFEKLFLRLAGCFFAWEPACVPPQTRKGDGVGNAGRSGGRAKCGVSAGDGGEQAGDRAARAGDRAARAGDRAARAGNAAADLRLIRLTKSYGGSKVLDGVSAVYGQGGTYYLTSPSGSGKTTLLRILAGLTEPDGGRVEASFLCGMVFQEDRLCGDYSAVKNVELAIGDRGRAEEALGQLLEEDALHKPCSQLSGGMKRRVALVRAMEADSDYILLDEPFTGMDAQTRARAEDYIRRRQRGRTLVIATHI